MKMFNSTKKPHIFAGHAKTTHKCALLQKCVIFYVFFHGHHKQIVLLSELYVVLIENIQSLLDLTFFQMQQKREIIKIGSFIQGGIKRYYLPENKLKKKKTMEV
jgi:hypothetical protein